MSEDDYPVRCSTCGETKPARYYPAPAPARGKFGECSTCRLERTLPPRAGDPPRDLGVE